MLDHVEIKMIPVQIKWKEWNGISNICATLRFWGLITIMNSLFIFIIYFMKNGVIKIYQFSLLRTQSILGCFWNETDLMKGI